MVSCHIETDIGILLSEELSLLPHLSFTYISTDFLILALVNGL